uniref:Trypsin n=1 Tax=Lygus hesperus TaxID=30085 RepID=A0A0A9WE06_LYGHE
MPWPPKPILYDLTLKDKEVDASNLHWGMHRGRQPQTVAILSFYTGQPPVYIDQLKEILVVETNLAYMLTTMCDQDYCEKDFPELLHPEEKPQNATRQIGCFCDYNPKVCRGLYGSPIVHNGDVYGLLVSKVKCSSENPRATIGKAISIETMDWIVSKVPGIFERLGHEANSSKFREGAIVSNYEVDIPMGSDAI